MKKRLAIITGGNSSENVIAVKSADTIIENIDAHKFICNRVEIKGANWLAFFEDKSYPIDKNDFSFSADGVKYRFDLAVIVIHGDPGEDGKLQGYLEMLEIPYTCSNVLSSAASFNKHFTKQYLKSYGVLSADWMLLNRHSEYKTTDIKEKIGFPCFVKPNNAGSSFGVSKVSNKEQLDDAVSKALSEDDEVIVEKMVEGTEITCGYLKTDKNSYSFPIAEIVSKTGFFDYEAKYTAGLADEILPARIDENIAVQCQQITKLVYELFNCKWFARVDYIVSNQQLFLLEINTIPGMSKESIIPKMVRAQGLNLQELLSEIIEDNLES